MRRAGLAIFFSNFLLLGGLCWSFSAPAEETAPDFKEFSALIKSHLSNVSDAELNRAAVLGVINALAPRVMLVSRTNAAAEGSGSLVTRSNVFDGTIAYIRVAQVSDGLPDKIAQIYEQLAKNDRIQGLALDLRFAGGGSYPAAAAVVDLFLKQPRPLLNWGEGMKRSAKKSQSISVPVAALVDHRTSGAAEALAGALRESGAGLLLGSTTAGQAMIYRDFPLQNGETLRIAVGQVELGDGTALTVKGVTPDIVIDVPPREEALFYADPFRVVPQTNLLASATGGGLLSSTNGARRTLINEAELVRERRDTAGSDSDPRTRRPESVKPVISDPALARAVDLLKGLAVVRQNRL